MKTAEGKIRRGLSRASLPFIIVLLFATMMLGFSCGSDGSVSELVSLTRIRMGDLVNGECRFSDDLPNYPVAYSNVSDDCYQAVTIGPLTVSQLEEMKQDEPSFWENSFPYWQALAGRRIDGECKFESPAVRAYLEFSTAVSTNEENCIMVVNVGPATEEQIRAVERHGSMQLEIPVPAPGQK